MAPGTDKIGIVLSPLSEVIGLIW